MLLAAAWDYEVVMCDVCVACRSAIRTWAGREGQLSRELRAMSIISEEFLSRWLGLWMLARSNPKPYRPALAAQLGSEVLPQCLTASDKEMPELVSRLAVAIQAAGATRGIQTSLVSKFAFSIRPEVIVPYDRRARLALSAKFGSRLKDHDYPAYLVAFHRFAEEFAQKLDASGKTDELRPEWGGCPGLC